MHISNLSLTTNPHRGNSVLGRAQQGGLQKLRHRTHNRLQVNKVDSLESLKKKKKQSPTTKCWLFVLSCLIYSRGCYLINAGFKTVHQSAPTPLTIKQS